MLIILRSISLNPQAPTRIAWFSC